VKQIFLGLLISITFMFSSKLFAEYNWYFKVDREIQEIYLSVEGVSLEYAIDSLILLKEGQKTYHGDVLIRFDGFFGKTLFIGKQNTLEIWVKNDKPIKELSLAFELKCSGSISPIDWTQNHGTITPYNGPPNALKIVPEAFKNECDSWLTSAEFRGQKKDTLIISAQSMDETECVLAYHPVHVLLYSLQLKIPWDRNLIGETIAITSISIPTENEWYFTQSNPPLVYPPFYNNCDNIDQLNPDAPADTFDITIDGKCKSDMDYLEFHKDRQRISYNLRRWLMERFKNFGSTNIKNSEDNYILRKMNGIKIISAKMRYEGDYTDLEELGVIVHPFRPEGYPIYVDIPIDKLPNVCQLKSVSRISSSKSHITFH